MRWYDRTLAATFEPFVERHDGAVTFANRQFHSGDPFMQRHWPVFSLVKRGRLKCRRPIHHRARRDSDQITESSRLCEARRWLPCNPLDAHAMKAEDARLARRFSSQ